MNITEICPGVQHIETDYRVYCTLVTGPSLAILWDTGTGKRDLRAYLEGAFSTPLLVLNSHGHFDHVGGNHQFPQAWLAREDWPLLPEPSPCRLKDLSPGMTFDLGDETAECVSLSGHTRGSRGLLLRKQGLLLAGDALDLRLQLLGEEAAPPEVLQETLLQTAALPFDRFLASHAPRPLPKAQVYAHLRHAEALEPSRFQALRQAGLPVWRSEWRGEEGRSAFVLGEPLAKRLGL